MSDLTHLDGTPADPAAQPAPTDAPTGWTGVTDDSAAQWALRTLASYHSERDRIRRNAQAEVERIQTKALADEKPIAAKIDWLTNELTGYHRRLLAADPKRKTYKLPGGNLVHRKGRTSTVINDAEEFTRWALETGTAALKMTPQVSALTPAHGFARTDDGVIVFAKDGEIVPGVSVVTGDDSYTVSLSTGGEA